MGKTKTEQEGIPQQIWYIGFRPVPKQLPRPWRWFIHKNFSHVLAFRYDPKHEVWIFLEWSGMTVFAEIWEGKEMDSLFTWLKHDGALVSYEARHNPSEIIKLRMPFYCVSWVKHLLGLRNCIAMTPYQLYKELIKRGGTVIYNGGDR